MKIFWWRKKNRVAIIDIDGVITDSRFGASRTTVLEALERAEAVSALAVVVRLNSPGGTVAASQEIHQSIKTLRQRGVPVVASFGDVAASGSVYIAVGADKIVSNPGTITGSIGVVLKANNLRGLYQKIGVEEKIVKSGPYKDILSTFRPLTDQERRLLQEVIDNTYEQFVAAVATGRNLSEEQVRTFADGRIFTGQQAKDLGLVDELGGFERAVQLAGELGGIVGKPRRVNVMPRKRGILGRFFKTIERVELEVELVRGLSGIPLWMMPM